MVVLVVIVICGFVFVVFVVCFDVFFFGVFDVDCCIVVMV